MARRRRKEDLATINARPTKKASRAAEAAVRIKIERGRKTLSNCRKHAYLLSTKHNPSK